MPGFGDRGGEANYFAPQTIQIYTGDTITWRVGGALEPHTVTFGPKALLDKLAAGFINPIMQKAGPPIIAFNPQVALPSGRSTYSGAGFVSSGLLIPTGPQVRSWKLTFTKPGTYTYICLLHPGMTGTVTGLPAGQ